ncbi:NAD(P)-dependent oxidoreductase [Phytohabitans aurantiacus]|uniref:NAD(P)-binding domain-containing protein n=1 Tax=Phytohabitans aurantiacus TaxID=3016789 RepID=A0ABQ5R3H6_9ACTN|nr:NAD(P)H-binding protein [Phytohabitans aurantiacus]GLI00868.1 hypothetical protein Pa4123_61440 [Phytohabitans aurantiacus]
MSIASSDLPRRVAVFGAAGRTGRAVTATLLQQNLHVDAVLREPSRHDPPHHPNLRVIRGDAQRPEELAADLRAVDAIVLSVTPFTAPPSSFDGFDLDYYAKIVAGVDANWHGPRRRLVAVGLTATLRLDSGKTVMDDPALFPPELMPFAEAHARQLSALAGTSLDWTILAPPAGFGARQEPEVGQGYRLVTEPLTRQQATAQLTHAQYAQAVAAELVHPTVHAARAAVIPSE